MKKIAIFVEGDTELEFTDRLVTEIFGYEKVSITRAKAHGNSVELKGTRGAPQDTAEFQFLITNCCCDGKVKSLILERQKLLHNKGYDLVIGLQDLYPKPLTDLQKFEAGIATGLEKCQVKTKIFVAVKEIEAWFLNEAKHFSMIDPILVPDTIKEKVNFHPISDSAETSVNHPAGLLDEIYSIAGHRYQKRAKDVMKVVSALDYGEIYATVRGKSQSLSNFIDAIEEVFQ